MSAPNLVRITPSVDGIGERLVDAVRREREAAAERKALAAVWLDLWQAEAPQRLPGATISRRPAFERKGSVDESACIDFSTLEAVLRSAGMWNKRLATLVGQCKGKAPRKPPTLVSETVVVSLKG